MISHMNITTWNVRGLNDKDKQSAIQEELKRVKANINLLSKMKSKKKNLNKVMARTGIEVLSF